MINNEICARTDAVTSFATLSSSGNSGHIVVAISSNQIGSGDESHGEELLLAFLQGLCERATLPDEIVFYHRGVLLLVKGHLAEQVLSNLCTKDVIIKVSIESLKYYKKEPAVLKIQPVPMSEITRDLLRADRVIHP